MANIVYSKLNLLDLKEAIENYREEQNLPVELNYRIKNQKNGFVEISYDKRIYDEFIGGEAEFIIDDGEETDVTAEIITIKVNERNMIVWFDDIDKEKLSKLKKEGKVNVYRFDYLEKLQKIMQQENSYSLKFQNYENQIDTLNQTTQRINFKNLRKKQKIALKNSLNQNLFVWGPPGTGKTYTIGAIAAKHLEKFSKVLLLSTSNVAVDTALIAVSNACELIDLNIKKPTEENYIRLLRLGYSVKKELLEMKHITQYTNILKYYAKKQKILEKMLIEFIKIQEINNDNNIETTPIKKLIQDIEEEKDIEIENNDEINIIVDPIKKLIQDIEEEKDTEIENNDDINIIIAQIKKLIQNIKRERNDEMEKAISDAKLIATTFHSFINRYSSSFNFAQDIDTIIIDEASMVPLAMIYFILEKTNPKHLIIAGDPKQLIPVNTFKNILNKENIDKFDGVKTWFGANIYEYLKLKDFNKKSDWFTQNKVVFLDEQSRMHEEICQIVSNTFYSGKLKTIGEHETLYAKSNNKSVEVFPVNFLCYEKMTNITLPGKLETFLNKLSARRPESLKLIARLLISLYEIEENKEAKTLLITPYRNQSSALEHLYKKMKSLKLLPYNGNILNSTIHRIQGDEADIVIFDVADASNNFLKGDNALPLWNVAVSRAKKALFVISSNYERNNNDYLGKMFPKEIPCMKLY